MSKKKSDLKNEEMLDAALMGEETVAAPKMDKNGEVSLLEYSKNAPFSFNVENYKILIIGLAVNVLGYLLMMGGGTDNPAEFDASELFSTVRITVAPALIVLGFAIIAYGIMRRPKTDK